MPDEVVGQTISGSPEFIVNVEYRAARIAKNGIYAFVNQGVDQ
jgi:hypothetical protein